MSSPRDQPWRASGILHNAVALVCAFTVGWLGLLLLALSPSIQRHVFYLHKLPIWWGQDLDCPESFGFLPGQVLSLKIAASGDSSLFAWLVIPLGLYASHESRLNAPDSDLKEVTLSLLQEPDSLLLIYFHGNAGTVGQTRRTDAYRMISSSASHRIFVLAFDYRGFGRSSGTPGEEGLIDDAREVLRWATDVAKVPSDRIVLLAQSLGTAVAVGLTERMLDEDSAHRFAGIILCAAFTDASSVILSYKILGVPVLALFSAIKAIDSWFSAQLRDSWKTEYRIARIVKQSSDLRLTFFAATSDQVVPICNTHKLFYTALQCANGAITKNGSANLVRIDGGDMVSHVQLWTAQGTSIKKVIVRYGGRSRFRALCS